MKKQDAKQFLTSLQDEREGALLYETLAKIEKDERIADVYRRMGETEQKHAETWETRLNALGVNVPPFYPTWRTRLLIWLSKRFGPAAIIPTIMDLERQNSQKYLQIPEADKMAVDESSHARMLTQIRNSSRQGMEGSQLAAIEGRHRSAGGNALRAAVLGANDGLVSNLSLVMGVAGANLPSSTILITGLAGLLAGAISMALGEWLSVQSSRELYQRQLDIEKVEIENAPEEEAEELALIYQARGIPEDQARQMAKKIVSDQDSALDALAREELGFDPQELGGSAWEAAITSFVLFAIGAIIPVFPFFFLEGISAIVVSIVLSAVGLFLIGSGITLFTGRSVLYSGTRQVLFGLVAALVTFLIGRLIGVNIQG